jgi:hypothetical protein
MGVRTVFVKNDGHGAAAFRIGVDAPASAETFHRDRPSVMGWSLRRRTKAAVMLRLLARLLGVAALAGAMATGVVDGARSIADGSIVLTSIAGLGELVLPRSFQLLGTAIASGLHSLLLDPLLRGLMRLPAVPALFVLGAVGLAAGRRKVAPIAAPD